MSQYIQNLQASIAEHQRIIDAGLPEAAQAQQIIDQNRAEISRVESSGGGGEGGGNQPEDPGLTFARQQAELQRQDQIRNVTAIVNSTFAEYGLGSLIPLITQYAQQGYQPDAIAVMLRQTPEYKQRFPAMSALAAKGRAISEAAYISYERTASSLERQYGLPQGMLMNNVTNMLTNEVSMEELNERVLLASAASINAPETLKQTFRNFYGVDALTAYFLDPTIATPLLQKQVATAEIGEAAMRQNVGLGLDMASQLQELGITREGAMSGFQQVGRTQSLQSGRGDTVTQQQAIGGVFGVDQESQRALERAQRARTGRFEGGGGFASEREGITGLGSAAR
jgi:hypothetical protein